MEAVDYKQTRAFDHFPFYPRVAVTALGLIQILMGLLSIALGVGAICTLSSGYYIAYGIWCGFMFTVSGGISIGSGIRKSSCMVITTMILSIICSCLAVVQLSLGIVAAVNDSPQTRNGIILNYEQKYIYPGKNSPFDYYCTGPNYMYLFTWSNAWAPVDILLLLVGFIQLAAALTVSIMGCHAACCGKRVPAVTYYTSNRRNKVAPSSNRLKTLGTPLLDSNGVDKTAEFWSYDERIENARSTHFKRLKGVTYLDHTGATLYSEVHLSTFFADMSSSVYGNPHSHSPSSIRSSEIVEEVRNRVLRHFNASAAEYAVIFTSNATAALKIVGQCFNFQGSINETQNCYVSNGKHSNPYSEEPLFAYLADNHTSVLGVRELLKSQQVSFKCFTPSDIQTFELSQQNASVHQPPIAKNISSNNLFAYPAQSNFSGQRYPLSWVKKIQGRSMFAGCHGNWYVLLDAASFLTTSTIDLTKCQPDFLVLSFYKIFGYPTGLGALLVKRSSGVQLRKTYFGGGTVDAALATEDFHVKCKDLSERFEDGTLPFLEILAVKHGFDCLLQLTGSLSDVSMHSFGLAKYVHDQMVAMHHLNGRPLVKMYCSTGFLSAGDQGPIINFNLLNSDGSFIGFVQVEKLAQLYNIHVRTGCFCNSGACLKHLSLTPDQVKANLKAGHTCGDDMDLVDGQPIGSIRASFGFCSTFSDAETFLRFIRQCFLHAQPEKCLVDIGNEPMKTNELEVVTTVGLSNGLLSSNHGSQNDEPMHLIGIRIYPVKSCAALLVPHRNIGPRGLLNDREWMIINDAGVCISQKRQPNMCCIQPSIDEKKDCLLLSYPGSTSLSVPLLCKSSSITGSTQMCNSKVCGDRVLGSDCGEEAATWLQSVIDKPGLRLVQQTTNDVRVTNRSKTESTTSGKLSLANEAQFLLVCTASLKRLLAEMRNRIENGDISEEEGSFDFHELLDRFRPNLVVETQEAFVEDNWKSVRIGSETFVSEGPCNRCQMVCINQKTGERTKEPLRSLIAMASGRKSTFGILLRHVGTSGDAQLSLGDAVIPCYDDPHISEP